MKIESNDVDAVDTVQYIFWKTFLVIFGSRIW